MRFKRLIKHLLFPQVRVARCFPDPVMDRIEAGIARSEVAHGGEIRFAVEGSLDLSAIWRGVTARQRALAVFSELGVWDTEANNGVLIYLLLAEHDVEIIADRGCNGRIDAEQWQEICGQMEACFAKAEFEAGVMLGIRRIHALLAQHFPTLPGDRNLDELPNRPVRR